jgi:predicted enzyme related to lactoylglutathione lyase
MINGGNATIFVADMDKAVRFYTEVLGLELRFRAGNHWAEVRAGVTLVIGLHPESPMAAPPGTKGAIQIGLNVTEPLEGVIARLREQGVDVADGIAEDREAGRFATLNDLDGNRTRTAKQLGIGSVTLYRKLKKYGQATPPGE